jgi:hypothetical protein
MRWAGGCDKAAGRGAGSSRGQEHNYNADMKTVVRRIGTWVSAYEEWQEILESGSDGTLFAAMSGRDEDSNRLRQSLPFVGLLSQERVREIYEEAGG